MTEGISKVNVDLNGCGNEPKAPNIDVSDKYETLASSKFQNNVTEMINKIECEKSPFDSVRNIIRNNSTSEMVTHNELAPEKAKSEGSENLTGSNTNGNEEIQKKQIKETTSVENSSKNVRLEAGLQPVSNLKKEDPSIQLKTFNSINTDLVKATKSLPTPVQSNVNASNTSGTLATQEQQNVSPSKSAINSSSLKLPNNPSEIVANNQENVSGVKGKRRRRKEKTKGQEETDKARTSKRIRLQYRPYQAPDPMSTIPVYYRDAFRKNNQEDVKIIVFNRGDFLAVRNDSGTFFICKATQNVYKNSKKFKIQWLNNEVDSGVYIVDFYDQIDFECVLTNVKTIRLEKGKYSLPKSELKRITNILERAINVEKGISEIPDPKNVAMDGVDVSVVGQAEEMELEKITPKFRLKKQDRIIKNNGTPNTDEKIVKKRSKKQSRKKHSAKKSKHMKTMKISKKPLKSPKDSLDKELSDKRVGRRSKRGRIPKIKIKRDVKENKMKIKRRLKKI